MIIVTGATGQLGRAIVETLLEQFPETAVGASVRSPENAADLNARGVRVRYGDFSAPDSLAKAFEGATQVLIVSSNARLSGEDPLVQHGAAIQAARAAGARRIVYTSQMAASASSAFAPMHDHQSSEDLLRGSGMAWTALRHGFYGSSGLAMMGDAMETGVLTAPNDGKIAWTAHSDLAEAAARLLIDEGRYEGPTPPLTGSQALDLADLAEIASGVLGRSVSRERLSDEDFQDQMARRGLPERAVQMTLGLYRASRNGEFSTIDPALEQLLGRPPVTMRDLIAAKYGRPSTKAGHPPKPSA